MADATNCLSAVAKDDPRGLQTMEGLSLTPSPDKAVSAASTEETSDSLCRRCRDLNVKGVLANYREAVENLNEYIVADLGDVEDMKQSSCPLCQFFASMALGSQTDKTCDCFLDPEYHTFPDIDTHEFQLRAMTVGDAYLGQEVAKSARQNVSGLQDQVMLGLAPAIGDNDVGMGTGHHCWYRIGMIAQVPASTPSAPPNAGKRTKKPWSLQTRRIVADHIPYDILTGWLDQCRNHHGEECQDVSFTDPPCVKVIDCNTLEIVKAPQRCQYLALSYVWGSTQEHGPGPIKRHGDPTALVMPDEMALVVTDSMEVTRRLGYQYLWIDKYCIDQDDPKEKASQISCMDQIYECSIAVLVAAGGKDSAFGLPGVTTRSRIPQPTVSLQGITLCSTLPNTVYTIRRSGWMTRGWTFQEAIFSKRRLYFTEHQVVFECDTTNYSEVFDHPWHIEIGQHQHENSIFDTADIPEDSPMTQHLVICSQIEEYSGRNITFDFDALDAFLSFFTRMERLKRPIYQFYGLPILKRSPGDDEDDDDDDDSDEDDSDGDDSDGDDDDDRDDDDDDDDDDDNDDDEEDDDDDEETEEEREQSNLSRGLPYLNPVNFLVEALCWYHKPASPDEMAAIRRRPTFPSWTWLGWTGKLSYTKNAGMSLDELDDLEIEVEDKDGRLWPWATWADVMEILTLRNKERLSGRLRVKGWLEQVKIKYIGQIVSQVFFVERKGRWQGSQLYISGGEKDENEEGGNSSGNDMNDLYAKLLESKDNTWELLSLGHTMMLLQDEGNGQYSRWGLTGQPESSDTSVRSSKKSRKRDSQGHEENRSDHTSQSHRKWVELWLI
jgi:hypothetical protein